MYRFDAAVMSEQSDVTQGMAESVMDTGTQAVNQMPASETAPSAGYASGYGPGNRFLTKDKKVHQILGGGRGEVFVRVWHKFR